MTESTIADESRVSAAPIERVWPDGWILLLHIALPIAITGAIIGRRAILARLWTHIDKTFISVFCPSFSKREKLTKWMIEHLPNAEGGLAAMWKDGSLMCTLINSVVPGACPNPHRHWRKPPLHGQALAYKYLGVAPIFTEQDFGSGNQRPSPEHEEQLVDYVCSLQAAIEKHSHTPEVTYSTRYIARGMGLVTGEQHRKTEIYIYPNFKGQSLDDLLVNIRGPYNTYGSIVLKALVFTADDKKHAELPDKRQWFHKKFSADFSSLLKSRDKPSYDIEIRTELETERAKLIFVPHNSGMYEICLTTNGEHISGSPFNLSIEKNRSGITQNLNDAKQESGRKKVDRKKVPVIYYNKQDEERCKIDLFTDANYNTEKITTLDDGCTKRTEEGEEKEQIKEGYSNVDQKETAEKQKDQEELTLPILETLAQLNNLLESTEKLTVEETPPKRNNFGLNIIDTLREIPLLKGSGTKVSSETTLKIENSHNDPIRSMKDPLTSDPISLTELEYPSLERRNSLGLADSGTYLTEEDMDPDSLSSSIELQGSSEEISYSGASDANESEVNNNDIMAKSNEDICYLILNQNTTNLDNHQHERVYSKDFISCQEQDQDQDKASKISDFSKSDPNLHHNAHNSHNITVSALSQDNVQEAPDIMSSSLTSGIFPNHSQEEPEMKKTFVGRSYSYSQGNLPDATETNVTHGYEFKEHFLKRKAFWSKISTSNVSLSTVSEQKKEIQETIEAPQRKEIKHIIVRTLRRTESVRSLELRSRSLDYVRQRKKESVSRTASVDDLNFPSVRHRREFYLSEKKSPTPEVVEKPELYAVRGEKYSWSINDKIKNFETGTTSSTSSLPPSQSQQVNLPENITITTKIKERFESAHTYFKQLEAKPEDHTYFSGPEKFSSLRLHKTKDQIPEIGKRHTRNGFHSLNLQNDRKFEGHSELQAFFNEHKKRKPSRTLAGDVFN